MPDPVLFLKAVLAAAAVSGLWAFVCLWWRRPAGPVRTALASLGGILLGTVVGCLVFKIKPHWPPTAALDRFLTLILPLTLAVELIASIPRVPRWGARLLRVGLAAVAGRILLHGSSYLAGSSADWTMTQIALALGAAAGLLLLEWSLLLRLLNRAPGLSIPASTVATVTAGGLALMLSGYLTGGQVALPIAGSLAAVTLATRIGNARGQSAEVIGVGVVSLFGILILGRFFGELTTARALAIFLAPLLAWSGELPFIRRRKPWQIALVRIGLVAIPLAAVLFLAQRDFAAKSAATGADEYEMYQP
jgi:hypothetical protein